MFSDQTILRRLLLLSAVLLALPTGCRNEEPWPGPLTLAGFNVHYLTTQDEARDWDALAEVVGAYDLLGLSELQEPAALELLVERLGDRWEYVTSQEFYGGGGYKEGYGFLFRTDRVELVADSARSYEGKADFTRPPFFADFLAGDFDFTLGVVHIIYGDSIERRREEVGELTQALGEVQAADDQEDDVILVGDFNLPPDDRGWDKLEQAGWSALLRPPLKTTLGAKGLASLYDNIVIFPETTGEHTGELGADNFVVARYGEDTKAYEQAESAISDHLPVWARFSTTADDD